MLARDNFGALSAVFVVLWGINVAIDVSGLKSGTTFISGLASLGGQFYLTSAILTKLGLTDRDAKPRFMSFWGANILSSIGIALGLVLLVVPGVYLAARWSASGPAVLSGDKAAEALSRSWRMTADRAMPIAIALLVIFVPLIGIGVILAVTIPDSFAQSIVLNGFVFAGLCLSWVLAAAIYSLLAAPHGDLADVFA